MADQREREREHGALSASDDAQQNGEAWPNADPRQADDGRGENPNVRADRNWGEILQELRVTQTGTQILGGFLLAVAFQPRFRELDDYQLTLYLVLVGIAGIATALGLAPVSLHRVFFGHRRKAETVRWGSRLLAAQLAVVSCLAAGVTSLVFDFTVGRTAGLITLISGLGVVGLLLGVLPRWVLRRGQTDARDPAAPIV